MPDWSIFKDIPFERRFSVSKAVLLNQCPGKFGFQYEQKIKEPTGPPIWCGNYFEWLIAGKKNEKGQPCPNPVPMLQEAQQKILEVRFEKYKAHLDPRDKHQVPIMAEIPESSLSDDLGNFYFIGFLDRDEFQTSFTVDHKVAGKPWDIKKLTYSMRQAQVYYFATGNPKFRFDVINLLTDEIQQFPNDKVTQAIMDDWFSKTQMDYFLNWTRAMLRIMLSDQRPFQTGPLCNWCYYKKIKLCKANG